MQGSLVANTGALTAWDLLHRLADADDYVLFGSFAGLLLAGTEWSADIDVLMRDGAGVFRLSSDLRAQGWQSSAPHHHDDGTTIVISLSRRSFTVDLCHYPHLTELAFATRTRRRYEDLELHTVSPELYFLLKLNHLTYDRDEARSARDRRSIARIRPLLDIRRLEEACRAIGSRFWLEGRL